MGIRTGEQVKYALVSTTINVPHNLKAYVRDIADHNPRDTLVVIAGDKKTPVDTDFLCRKLENEYGICITYLTPEVQELAYPKYSKFLGWNTIQRRNMALLHAYECGAEIIVTIDDDNYLTSDNYLNKHGAIGEKTIAETVSSHSGWYNNCKRLQCTPPTGEFYPRGYSLSERGTSPRIISELQTGRTVVNAGLWVGDPDIDAVTRLAINPKVTNAVTLPFALAKDTYCPFNSQNTALHRDVIPAYCMVSGVGRYDDILPSFFVKAIADHLGDSIKFGEPIVRQERNQHNLWKDFDGERVGMQLTDRIVDWLRTVEFKGSNYSDCLSELLKAFTERWSCDGSLTIDQRMFIHGVLRSYEAWGEVLCK